MAADREGLREALAHDIGRVLCECGPGLAIGVGVFERVADAVLALPEIADLLTKADSAERMEEERDEARATVERLSFADETGAVWRPVPGWSYLALHDKLTAAQADVARLSAEVEVRDKALEPFAKEADRYDPPNENGDILLYDCVRSPLRVRHLREARAALSRTDKADSRERGE